MHLAAPWFDDPRFVRLGLSLVHFLWEGAFVGLFAGALSLAMRRAAPRWRYAACLCLFVAMTALPILTFALLSDGTLPHANIEASPGQLAVTSSLPGRFESSGENALPSSSNARALAPASSPRPTASSIPSAPAPVAVTPLSWADLLKAARGWTAQHSSSIVVVWLVGVCLCGVRLVLGLVGARRVRRRGIAPAESSCRQLCAELAERFGIRRVVDVYESVLVRAPVVVGWTAPVILLPASVATGLTPAQLRAVLAHEMAHVCRHDYLVNVFQTLAESLLFYHPAVWWLSAVLRDEREHCCDELAAEACQDKLVVAQALARLAAIERMPGPALAANGGRLLERIRRLLRGERVAQWRMDWRAGGALVVALGVVSMAVVMAGMPASPAFGDLAAAATEPATPPAKASAPADSPPTASGWKAVVDIPESRFPKDSKPPLAKLSLWEEKGWLVVRRTDPRGDIEWQVVLAHWEKSKRPVVRVDKQFGSIDIDYDRYFIRDDIGRLRVFRQSKEAGSPEWPSLNLPGARNNGMGSTFSPFRGRVELKGFFVGDWFWAMSGPPNGRFDVWVRLQRRELHRNGNGFEGSIGNSRMYYGDAEAVDEGDLFTARRYPADLAEGEIAVMKTREALVNHPAPPLGVERWLNSSGAHSLEELHGKVVLLDFWGVWCQPCVKRLPDVERLARKYQDRGLAVIAVHTQQDAEKVGEFLAKKPLALPVAVDTGETAKRYGVESWPSFVLIDRAGKVVAPPSNTPPSEAKIEELLR
jgi:beta-lactamase regulating signal transducer with metallopeptidase domain/thiol-disulfide isomerase/thioredoxin